MEWVVEKEPYIEPVRGVPLPFCDEKAVRPEYDDVVEAVDPERTWRKFPPGELAPDPATEPGADAW